MNRRKTKEKGKRKGMEKFQRRNLTNIMLFIAGGIAIVAIACLFI